jgi:carboxymethylenebutenolidase
MAEWIDLDGTDGGRAWLARPESGDGPGVVVLHAWWGLNGMIREYTERLAAEGFVAIAPDLYRGVVVDTIDAADAASGEVSMAAGKALVRAAVDRLRSDDRELGPAIGVVAFSFGCYYALDLAAGGNAVGAVVLHYGTGGAFDWSNAEAAFLGHFAADDPYESADEIEALRAALAEAGLEVRFETYPGTSHWFVEPDRPEYDEAAAALAWSRTIAFLRENLGPLGA